MILCFLLFMNFVALAQLNISTNYRQDGVWSESNEKWDILSTDDAGTLFEFNKELTTFKHTTPSITSSYYIKSYTYNDEEVLYKMQIKSDVGNEYEMLIDGINNCVCFFYYGDDGKYYMVRHTIKSTWINKNN